MSRTLPSPPHLMQVDKTDISTSCQLLLPLILHFSVHILCAIFCIKPICICICIHIRLCIAPTQRPSHSSSSKAPSGSSRPVTVFLARVPLKTFTNTLFSARHAALVSAPSLSPRILAVSSRHVSEAKAPLSASFDTLSSSPPSIIHCQPLRSTPSNLQAIESNAFTTTS